MELYIGLGVVVVLLVLLGLRVRRARPRQETGVANFRRHIDALSPEARREVQDRVSRHRAERPDSGDPGERR